MMKDLLVAAAVAGLAAAGVEALSLDGLVHEHVGKFREWQVKHDKVYATAEEEFERFGHFSKTLTRIVEHNKDADKHGWTQALNDMSDWSDEEWRATLIPVEVFEATRLSSSHSKYNGTASNGPNGRAVDWRERGKVVNQIKYQRCGDCWVFGATAAIESHWAIRHDTGAVMFSEALARDCLDGACGGGQPYMFYEEIERNGPLCTNDAWPYDREGHREFCDNHPHSDPAAVVTGHNAVDFTQFYDALHDVGPLHIAMAMCDGFGSYSGGVMSFEPGCAPAGYHAMVAVAFNDESVAIKNSQGPNWGMGGWGLVTTNEERNAGLQRSAGYPLIG